MLCHGARHIKLITAYYGLTQEDPYCHELKNIDWDVKNQIEQTHVTEKISDW